MASPIPKSPEQSEKSKKYDRQLRLWGDHGQAMLEGASVCLINANATGTEALKSIILPGCGAFTIVDGNRVTIQDVGNNFFLEMEAVGKSRAQVATQLLLELNSDVKGDYVDESPEQLLQNSPEFFANFSVVVATQLSERTLITLSNKLWEAGVPLIYCRSLGFIGHIRVQVCEHTVIESHPDNELEDLRLDRPFSGLRQHMASIDFSSMDLKDHSHTPYLVILFSALQKWKELHDGALPVTFKEKQQLKELIKSAIRRNGDGIPEEEENFEEAIRAVNTVLVPKVPSEIHNILNDDACINVTSKSKPFWIMARSLKDFVQVEGNGCLPNRGIIPDMTADSERYIALQNVYREQAMRDSELVYRRAQQLLQQLGRSQESISELDVRALCRHANHLHVTRGSSIASEYAGSPNSVQEILQHLEMPDSLMVHYVMLRGVDRFYSEYNTTPGMFDDHVEPDIVKLKSCISRLTNEWGGCGSLATKDDHVHEVCRYGGSEIHSVAAFVGGCVAQEVIKLVTGQYVPLDNTLIYDAISSTTATFRL